MARVYEIDGNTIKVAYPLDLFEEGNIPQLLSSIAGNIFGMRALKNLRLEDVIIPGDYVKYFKGAQFGIDGVRRMFNIFDRPLTATVPKPKVGFDADEYAEIAYEAWVGGIDLVKDDENLTSQPFIRFEKRLEKVMKARDEAEKDTGERKSYLVNITAETDEMLKRAKLVADYNNEFVMVDMLIVGWAALQTIRNACEELKLAIHTHRAMHAAFTRNLRHGISLDVIVKLARLVGADNFHVGSVGKMIGEKGEIKRLAELCRKAWHLKPIFPVSSGGLHPGLVAEVMGLLGNDTIIQAGRGVHGHPDGTLAGARALRQAIDAVMNEEVEKATKKHIELAKAIEKWGYVRPK
jgi:ribulose-bisphosphate carboxylase large chain